MDATIQAAAAKLVRQLKEVVTRSPSLNPARRIARQHADRHRWRKHVVSKILGHLRQRSESEGT